MRDHFLQYYHTLEIEPGCSFHDLKYAYRRLVRKWHPDRITEKRNAKDTVSADDKIKEITKAFRNLSEYYRENGFLPVLSKDDTQPNSNSMPQQPDVAKTSRARSSRRKKNSVTPSARRSMLIGTIVAITIVFWIEPWNQIGLGIDTSFPANSAYSPSPSTQTGYSNATVKPITQKPDQVYFTVGSTLGEVISIQGVPTATEEGIWHYGPSKVFFEKGIVVSWEQDSSSPLKVDILLPPHGLQVKGFTLGSTKSEVHAIQGTPLRESENMWEFRVSRVQFKNGKVSGWFDSPLDPLKLDKQPHRR